MTCLWETISAGGEWDPQNKAQNLPLSLFFFFVFGCGQMLGSAISSRNHPSTQGSRGNLLMPRRDVHGDKGTDKGKYVVFRLDSLGKWLRGPGRLWFVACRCWLVLPGRVSGPRPPSFTGSPSGPKPWQRHRCGEFSLRHRQLRDFCPPLP